MRRAAAAAPWRPARAVSPHGAGRSAVTASVAAAGVGVGFPDPFQVEALLTPEERAVADTVRRYCRERLLPRVTSDWQGEVCHRGFFKEVGAMGLFAPTLTGWDCAGLSSTAAGLIARELERVDSGYRSMWSVTSSLVMFPIATYGSEAVQERYLRPLGRGDLVGCFALTEANAGSDPNSMAARATCRGDEWELTGEKMWISNAPFADVFVVWAKDPADLRVKGFVLDRSMPGLSTSKIAGKLSLRSSHTGTIALEGVRVPDTHRLGVTGLRGPFSCLDQARYGIAWGAVGAGEACLEAARAYVLQRSQFGAPLASKQLVQAKLVEMHTALSLALLAAWRIGKLKDAGPVAPEAISLVKRSNCRAALDAARAARDLLGANGIIAGQHVMRHLCNMETVVTYEGTHDIHTLILGRAITGLPAF